MKRLINTIYSKLNRYVVEKKNETAFVKKLNKNNEVKKEFSSKKISSSSYEDLEFLKKNGYVFFHKKFFGLADYIEKEYIDKAQKNEIDFNYHNLISEREANSGRTVKGYINLSDKKIFDFIFKTDFYNFLYNYFKNDFFIRNLPMIQLDKFKVGNKKDLQSKFHIDSGFNQISIVLLCSDITKNDTHTEFLKNFKLTKSQLYQFNNRSNLENFEINDEKNIVHFVGEKGTIIIFEAGQNLHRANFNDGRTRKILHFNFNKLGLLPHQKKIKDEELTNYLKNLSDDEKFSLKFLQ